MATIGTINAAIAPSSDVNQQLLYKAAEKYKGSEVT